MDALNCIILAILSTGAIIAAILMFVGAIKIGRDKKLRNFTKEDL